MMLFSSAHKCFMQVNSGGMEVSTGSDSKRVIGFVIVRSTRSLPLPVLTSLLTGSIKKLKIGIVEFEVSKVKVTVFMVRLISLIVALSQKAITLPGVPLVAERPLNLAWPFNGNYIVDSPQQPEGLQRK